MTKPTCKTDGLCRTASICFLGGCIEEAPNKQASQQTPMRYDPATGRGQPVPQFAEHWREFNGSTAWLFNPWTGNRRAAEDVGSDTFGHLVLPPGEPITAPALGKPEAPKGKPNA